MDAPAHRVPIPRRRNPLAAKDAEPRGLIIVASVLHKMKVSILLQAFSNRHGQRMCVSNGRILADTVAMQGSFFFLLQSEDGDLYKVTIDHRDEDVVAVRIKYFDTVPVASSLVILKTGYLFVASEFGNQYV